MLLKNETSSVLHVCNVQALAIDEAKHGVRVNTVSPGNVWTPLWEAGAQSSGDPAKVIEGGNDAQLVGRMGTIEESGQLCLFLAAEGSFCTGIGNRSPISSLTLLTKFNANLMLQMCHCQEEPS